MPRRRLFSTCPKRREREACTVQIWIFFNAELLSVVLVCCSLPLTTACCPRDCSVPELDEREAAATASVTALQSPPFVSSQFLVLQFAKLCRECPSQLIECFLGALEDHTYEYVFINVFNCKMYSGLTGATHTHRRRRPCSTTKINKYIM